MEKCREKCRKLWKNAGRRKKGGYGAEGGTRTLTLSLAADFESAASTNSATSAKDLLIIKI